MKTTGLSTPQVAVAFLDGRKGSRSTCSTDGELLRSYKTIIARRIVRGSQVGVLVDKMHYSQTTSKLQKMVKHECEIRGIDCREVQHVLDDPPLGMFSVDENDNPTEPEESDYITKDYETWVAYPHDGDMVIERPLEPFVVLDNKLTAEEKKFFGPTVNPCRWQVFVKREMDRDQFWPNVWYQGERGDWNLLSLKTGKYV